MKTYVSVIEDESLRQEMTFLDIISEQWHKITHLKSFRGVLGAKHFLGGSKENAMILAVCNSFTHLDTDKNVKSAF